MAWTSGHTAQIHDHPVEGTDETHILRVLMCLSERRHVAVIWAVFFMFSLVAGRVLSLIVDGAPSRIFLVYLAVEVLGGL
jgi:hypothetical protein